MTTKSRTYYRIKNIMKTYINTYGGLLWFVQKYLCAEIVTR